MSSETASCDPLPRSSQDWVTVCAWTRRIKWQGRWISFEDFLAQRFNVRCTHGICDEELAKLKAALCASEPANSRS